MKEDSPARTDAGAYRRLRATAAQCSSPDDPVADVVLRTLPAAVAAVTGWQDVYLFNEHYIMKPSRTVSEFRWHRVRRLCECVLCGCCVCVCVHMPACVALRL